MVDTPLSGKSFKKFLHNKEEYNDGTTKTILSKSVSKGD